MAAIKCTQALKKDSKISEDICLLFDEFFLQKCEDIYFMIVGLNESIPCDRVISRNYFRFQILLNRLHARNTKKREKNLPIVQL